MSALFTLDEAKSWLNIDPANTEFDDRLTNVIDSVTTIVETRTGPLGPRTVTKGFPLGSAPPIGCTKIVLPNYPVTGVTSVDIDGDVVDPADYVADIDSGVIRFYYGIVALPESTLHVTYDFGSATVAANVALAAKIIAQDLWQEQMLQSATGQEPGQVDTTRYLIPRRALALLPKRARFA